jgi:hypothetical protein
MHSQAFVPKILILSLQQPWNTRKLCGLRCVLQTRVQDVWSKVSCRWLRPRDEPGPSLAQFPVTTPQTSMARAHRISTTTQRRACQVFLLQPSSSTLLSPSRNRSAKPHPSLTHIRCQETMSQIHFRCSAGYPDGKVRRDGMVEHMCIPCAV